jgi:hypothetical protein
MDYKLLFFMYDNFCFILCTVISYYNFLLSYKCWLLYAQNSHMLTLSSLKQCTVVVFLVHNNVESLFLKEN